jgi:hypothetical protein
MLPNRVLTDCRLLLTGSSRRDILKGLAVGFGLGSTFPALEADAKKKRKRRKKKPTASQAE